LNKIRLSELLIAGRVMVLRGPVDKDMVNSFMAQLGQLKVLDPREPTAVILNTTGGSDASGMLIHDLLQALATAQPNLWMIASHRVASIGIPILLAVPKVRRLAFPGATFYIHKGAITVETNVRGDGNALQYQAREEMAAGHRYTWFHEHLNRSMSHATGISVQAIQELIDDPRHLTVPEAIELGFIAAEIADR
jgi:ATP-dependent protease ClpP protease subunit